MTVTDDTTTTTPGPASGATTFDRVVLDLYRDIHKGIRAELFAVTLEAGRLDPADAVGRRALVDHVEDVAGLLIRHAEHEDGPIQPVLEQRLPGMAARIAEDHVAVEARIVDLLALAAACVDPPAGERRRALHRLYVELASFTAAYLLHQDLEEREVMPALQDEVGVEAVAAIHDAIVGPMPPDELFRSLAIMFPAMNVDDRAELLAGMAQGAPPEALEAVWSLLATVVEPTEVAALEARLGR